MSDEQQFECVVSADLFRRAMSAVSKEHSRIHLNGVHVEPCSEGGVLLVGTDGSRLIVFHDKYGMARNGTGIVQLNKDMIKALSAKRWNLPGWLGPVTGGGKKTRAEGSTSWCVHHHKLAFDAPKVSNARFVRNIVRNPNL